MTTAQVETEPLSETDRVISASVAALSAASGISRPDIARFAGMGVASLYRKLGGDSPWQAREVAALAELFEVSITDLFDGLGGRVGGARKNPRRPSPSGVRSSVSTRVRPEGFEPPTF